VRVHRGLRQADRVGDSGGAGSGEEWSINTNMRHGAEGISVSQGNITMAVETIHAVLAKAYLGKNGKNRKMRDHVVERYARDMTNGRWMLTGEAIKFDVAGNLLDGQHRLAAVERSGVPCEFLVVRGLDPSAMEALDSGLTRDVAIKFEMSGESFYAIACATAGLFRVWQTGKRLSSLYSRGTHSASFAELKEILDRNPQIRKSVVAIGNSRVGRICPPSAAAFCHALFSEINAPAANKFFHDLANGAGLESNDPVFRLREKLSAAKIRKVHHKRGEIITMLFRAWNARAESRTLTKMVLYKSNDETARLPDLAAWMPGATSASKGNGSLELAH
jgi:hypothetical protein